MQIMSALQTQWTLDRVLSPLSSTRFFETYWERQACTVRRGTAGYYAPLLSIGQLDSAITSTAPSRPPRVRLVRSDGGRMATREVPYSADGIPNMYALYRSYADEGYTISIDRLDLSWTPVAQLCRSIEDTLQHPIAANAYYTPPGTQGFLPHYDTHDVFVLQIEGSKVWRLYDYESVLPFPDETSRLEPDALGSPRETISLGSGDLLYIPRGHVHDAFATNEPSLHITVGIHVFRWADLIAETVSAATAREPAWREALPIGDSQEAVDSIEEKLRALLLRLADRAAEVRGHERLWRRLLANGHPLPDGHFQVLDALNELDDKTVVSKRRGISCKLMIERDRVSVHFAGNIIVGSPELAPALAFIASHERFAPRDLPDSLDPETKLALTRRFVREGLLTFEPSRCAAPAAAAIESSAIP